MSTVKQPQRDGLRRNASSAAAMSVDPSAVSWGDTHAMQAFTTPSTRSCASRLVRVKNGEYLWYAATQHNHSSPQNKGSGTHINRRTLNQ
jgi:hypothetical protein